RRQPLFSPTRQPSTLMMDRYRSDGRDWNLIARSRAVRRSCRARVARLHHQRTTSDPCRAGSLRIWRTIVTHSARRRAESEIEPVRVLGRGLRAARGVHLTLRTLREAAGKTQVDVAKQSQIDQ